MGTTSLGNMEAKGKGAGQPTPDADSNDHLREAVKTETPIFGQVVTKGAMLNFPTPKRRWSKLLPKVLCTYREADLNFTPGHKKQNVGILPETPRSWAKNTSLKTPTRMDDTTRKLYLLYFCRCSFFTNI